MGILNRLRDLALQPNIDDAHYYAQIAKEIESGYMREGLWAKALSETNFDKDKAKSIYMRMAVKALQQEYRDQTTKETARQKSSMDNAVSLYNAGHYSEAQEGLQLRAEKLHDHHAIACLANIAWHGLIDGKPDREYAKQLLLIVEQSDDLALRTFLGQFFENIDCHRALANYDFASSKGNVDATNRARKLRRLMKEQGLLPKGLLGPF